MNFGVTWSMSTMSYTQTLDYTKKNQCQIVHKGALGMNCLSRHVLHDGKWMNVCNGDKFLSYNNNKKAETHFEFNIGSWIEKRPTWNSNKTKLLENNKIKKWQNMQSNRNFIEERGSRQKPWVYFPNFVTCFPFYSKCTTTKPLQTWL